MTQHKTHHSESLNLSWHSAFEISTKIYIEKGGISKIADVLTQIHASSKVLILHQPGLLIAEIENIKSLLLRQGLTTQVLELADGEACKSVDCLTKIWEVLHELKFARHDTIVAVGGGTVTDVAGLAASTYLRGINLVTVPTTLLAQVDAAVGGKTAVNFRQGKNLVGSFYFAKATIVDINTLATLPAQQFISGLAEIIKYALIEKTIAENSEYALGHYPLIDILPDLAKDLTWNNVLLPGIVAACIKMKLATVAKDPLETNLRRCLNFGHTLGHALETVSTFSYSHGQAVAIGMAFALRVAVSYSQISTAHEQKALSLMQALGLPTNLPVEISVSQLLEALFYDKKREGEAIYMILPKNSLGQVEYTQLISKDEIEKLLSIFV